MEAGCAGCTQLHGVGLCCGRLEHFVPEVSPKSQTIPAVPGKARPGLLRLAF